MHTNIQTLKAHIQIKSLSHSHNTNNFIAIPNTKYQYMRQCPYSIRYMNVYCVNIKCIQKLTVLPLEICEMEIKGRREGRERYAINLYKLSQKKTTNDTSYLGC